MTSGDSGEVAQVDASIGDPERSSASCASRMRKRPGEASATSPLFPTAESVGHLALRALVGVVAIVAALVAALASISVAAQTVLAIVSLIAATASVRWMILDLRSGKWRDAR